MIQSCLGDQRTTEHQLNDAGSVLFGPKWGGVFAHDEPHPTTYCLVNTGTRASGGSHWLAHAHGVWYDSFGRDEYGDKSGDAEQRKDEYDCGQRSLAWLCVVETSGVATAKLI